MLDENLIDRVQNTLKKLSSRVDYLEIRCEESRSTNIPMRKSGVHGISSSHSLGGCVRACYKGGWGFTSFSDLEKLEEFTQEACRIAILNAMDKTRLAEIPAITDQVFVNFIVDPREISLEEKVRRLDLYRQRMLAIRPDLIQAIALKYAENFTTKYFCSSEGASILQEFSLMNFFYTATAIKNAEQTFMMDYKASPDNFGFLHGLEYEVDTVCNNAVLFADAKPMESGEFTAILNPNLAGVFVHESFGHTSEADIYAANPKVLNTLKIDRRFGPDSLSIFDSGEMDQTPVPVRYDDEGVLCKKSSLIENGILKGRLHNRETAARMGEVPNGNARAIGYSHPPIVRMRTTCIQEGNSNFLEMLDDIRDGVYCIDAYGGVGGEEFSFTPLRGFRIRNGKLCEPVKQFALTGNLFQTLANIDRIGGKGDALMTCGSCGKFEQFPLNVAMSSPHIRIQNLKITGQRS